MFILFYITLVFWIKLTIKNIFQVYTFLLTVSILYEILFNVNNIKLHLISGLGLSILINSIIYFIVKRVGIKFDDKLVNRGDIKLFVEFIKNLYKG